MAFTVVVNSSPQKTVFGNKRIVSGTWVNDGGSTGGAIATGLALCEQLIPVLTGASAGALAPSVNETLPKAAGSVTIVTNANDAGNWIAWGI